MNEKQQQLTFDKGITNVPSDALCSDNALAESVGMVYDDGEHRVIQKPKVTGNGNFIIDNVTYSGKLVYVHRHANTIRYIYVYKVSDSPLAYGLFYKTDLTSSAGESFCDFLSSNEVSIESVGKTLIVSDGGSLKYFLWNTDSQNTTYKYIGDKIPDIKVKFCLDNFSNSDITYNEKYVSLEGMIEGVDLGTGPVVIEGQTYNLLIAGSKYIEGKYETAKEALIGLVSMRLNQVRENNRFAFPFWARSAMRLYDGSHIHISTPYLLLPTIIYNRDIFTCDDNGNLKAGEGEGGKPGGWPQTNYKPYYAKLKYWIENTDISDWEDVISGIDIFVSEEIKTFDMEGQWTIQNVRYPVPHRPGDPPFAPTPYFDGTTELRNSSQPLYNNKLAPTFDETDPTTWVVYFKPDNYSEADIIKNLLDASVFYNIIEIDKDDIVTGSWIDSSDKIRKGVLKNLTTQTQLEYDDYFSYSTLQSAVMKSYNARLHLANIKRSLFGGFGDFSFTSYDRTQRTFDYYVHIKTESGLRIVKGPTPSVSTEEILDIWYFYPDPRAFKVDIVNHNTGYLVMSLNLKEHHRLHGAYYFGRLPSETETYPSETTVYTETVIDDPEVLEDVIMVSEVNNPFMFTAKGEIKTNLGSIISIATQTMSLGEQEHGLHPLVVFSERGISMLRVSNDGTYSRSDEVSREVCNNKKSITETDGPIYFSSDKGLMVLVGNQVKCVSEQMCGKTNVFKDGNNLSLIIDLGNFCDYLKNAYVAYDYRDSLLWIFNANYTTCYIYAIKSGTFSKFTPLAKVTSVVNDYPDYLLQDTAGKIYTLTGRDDINVESSLLSPVQYACNMLTRPMKLENALALKSIMQVRHITDFSDAAGVALEIYASNNLKTAQNTWVKLGSLRGKPWKYYRFRYDFTNLIATDRFAGSILVTQERRTDKLR